ARDFDLQVFRRLYIIARPAILVGKPVEQSRVNVVTDSKAEQTRAAAVVLYDVIADLVYVGNSNGRQAISDHHDHLSMASPAQLLERSLQSIIDVGPALGPQMLDERSPLVLALFSRLNEPRGHEVLFTGKRHDIEPVVVKQRADSKSQRGSCLVDLFAAHRTGRIEHKDYVFGFPLRCLNV